MYDDENWDIGVNKNDLFALIYETFNGSMIIAVHSEINTGRYKQNQTFCLKKNFQSDQRSWLILDKLVLW